MGLRRKETDYYEILINMAGYTYEAAKKLQDTLRNFDASKMQELMTQMHKIEEASDTEMHIMLEKLAHEFMTPIEREDIISLAQELDNITDYIEDSLIRLYMFDVSTIRNSALEFSDLMLEITEEIKEAVIQFKDFHKSPTLKDLLIKINSVESKGDTLYINAVRSLYTTCKNPIEIIGWGEIYRNMEKCLDAGEHASYVMRGVMMKNS